MPHKHTRRKDGDDFKYDAYNAVHKAGLTIYQIQSRTIVNRKATTQLYDFSEEAEKWEGRCQVKV